MFFVFKQKTAYEVRISDWSSDVCSSDLLPQTWCVLKGEMSFVGPRPERPSFVEELTRELPFYAERHMVKPGLTGWAQINYPYGASVEDARAKLEYRSEERRVGKECVRTCRSRWSPNH